MKRQRLASSPQARQLAAMMRTLVSGDISRDLHGLNFAGKSRCSG